MHAQPHKPAEAPGTTMLATEDYRAILGQADLGFSERLEIVKFIHWPVSSLTWGQGRSKGSKRMLTSELLLTVQLENIAPAPEHGLGKIRAGTPHFPVLTMFYK